MNDISADVLGLGYEQRVVLEHDSKDAPPAVKTTVVKEWGLSGWQTINNQSLGCPAHYRLEGGDYSPGRIVPRGVEVQEPGGVGVSSDHAYDDRGNSVGASGLSMTNWDPFSSKWAKVILHCETFPTTSMVKIYEPAARGGALISSFPASSARDTQGPIGIWNGVFAAPYWGILPVMEAGLPGKRIAAADGGIYVADRLRKSWVCDNNAAALLSCQRAGGEIRRYNSQGELLAWKSYGRDRGGVILGLDSYSYRGKTYVAVALNWGGVEVFDENLVHLRTVHSDWTGRGGAIERDMASMVKFFEDENGRLLLAAGGARGAVGEGRGHDRA